MENLKIEQPTSGLAAPGSVAPSSAYAAGAQKPRLTWPSGLRPRGAGAVEKAARRFQRKAVIEECGILAGRPAPRRIRVRCQP